MRGAFVTNAYLEGSKYDEPWTMMRAAAEDRGVELVRVTNSDLALPIGDARSLHRSVGDLDFAVFWDKDVRCAENLELCGIPVFNSSGCVRVCDDKALTHLALSRAGVPSVRTVSCPMSFDGFADEGFVERASSVLGFPMVVKDCFGSFGMQVRLVRDSQELTDLLTGPYVPRILQGFVDCGNRDVRVEVVGGECVAAMSRTAPEGDFRANATIGGRISAHTPSSEETDLAIRAAGAVGADFCGVDILTGPDGPVVCEVNSNAHMRNLLDCTGVDSSVHIMDHILSRLR